MRCPYCGLSINDKLVGSNLESFGVNSQLILYVVQNDQSLFKVTGHFDVYGRRYHTERMEVISKLPLEKSCCDD